MEPPSRQTAEWLDRLRGDMVPIVNNAQELIRRVFPYRSTKPGVSAFERWDGARLERSKSALYLYYRIVLVAIRYHEEEENRENKTAQDLESEKSVVKTLHYLKNSNFHNAFLCCSLEIVAFAFLPDEKFPWATSTAGQEHYMVDLWHAFGIFIHCFPSQDHPPPPELLTYLKSLQQQITDWRAFAVDSSFYTYASQGSGGFWIINDKSLIKLFLREVACQAISTTNVIADWWMEARQDLMIDVDDTDDDDDENYSNTFSCDCAQLMDEILFNNLFLIFGSSIPVLVACCVYGMTKAYNVHIGFLEIQESVFHIFPHVLRELMTKVEIGMEQDGTRQYGGICEFYNGVYLPSIRGYLNQKSDEILARRHRAENESTHTNILHPEKVNHCGKQCMPEKTLSYDCRTQPRGDRDINLVQASPLTSSGVNIRNGMGG